MKLEKAFIMYHEGTKILLENIKNNNIKEIHFNKSKFINYVIDICNAMQNNVSYDEIQNIINYYTRGKCIGSLRSAKMMLEVIIISYTNPFQMINIIAEKCNLNKKWILN